MEKVQEAAAKAAEEVVEKFEKEWEPMMDSLEESVETFGNIDGEPLGSTVYTPPTRTPWFSIQDNHLKGKAT